MLGRTLLRYRGSIGQSARDISVARTNSCRCRVSGRRQMKRFRRWWSC